MKTSKKLLSVLLAVLMLAGCFGLFASAEDQPITEVHVYSSHCPYGGAALPQPGDYEVGFNNGGGSQQNANACPYCGGTHSGFPGILIGILHRILALFGLRK